MSPTVSHLEMMKPSRPVPLLRSWPWKGGEGRVSRMGYEGKGGKDGGRSGVRGGGRGGGDDDGW